jgi:putative FmdB family regulatory protein
MPVYDYVCNDCHKTFEAILTLKGKRLTNPPVRMAVCVL